MAECRPSSSPASTTRDITVFPAGEVIVSFIRPLQSMYTPRGTCPSTNKTDPAGYELVNFIFWKSARVSRVIWQKNPSFRIGQVAQSSAISIPYGTWLVISNSYLFFLRGSRMASRSPRYGGGNSSSHPNWRPLSSFPKGDRGLFHPQNSQPPGQYVEA